jgi:NAD(P)-dependent dehydrogenase (short-subunit alcohol dehydrogenase family)
MSQPTELFDLTGKVAIVTGSTKGLGRAMVEALSAAGAAVVVSSRKQDLCDEVAEKVRAATGGEVLALACHVGDWDAIPGFVDAVVERFGTIDVLVNNAGINPAPVKVADMPLELWRKIFTVNLEGPLRMSQCVAPVMRDNGGGSIVHIGTMGAYYAGSDTVAYGASKAALKSLTVTMAVDWAPWKVRVNMLSPGPFMSEMVRGADRAKPGFIEMLASSNAMKRIADPSEIVGPVLYLASDASSYVTGDDITVAGGMRK